MAETGFGTGLNILALLDLWRAARPEGGRLSIFSVEAYPMAREEAVRALSAWPQLHDLADIMTARWPRRASGLHRVDLPEAPDTTLDLADRRGAVGITQWSGKADAWLLDGFAPAKNPQMWQPEVLAAARRPVRPRSAPVHLHRGRRGAAGPWGAASRCVKRPGHGRKRERLEAVMPGSRPAQGRPRPASPSSAGIAGAALAQALNAQGVRPLVIDAGAGDAASAIRRPWSPPRSTRRRTPGSVLRPGLRQGRRSLSGAGRGRGDRAGRGAAGGGAGRTTPPASRR